MFRITIEIVPGGREADTHTVAELEAVNVSHLADISSYTWRGWYQTMRGGRVYRAGKIHDWPRAQSAVAFARQLCTQFVTAKDIER